MKYDFSTLSADEFEDLSRDLVGADLAIRFEAFTVGTDSGIDGRHAVADGSIVLQAKHYFRSGFSKLKSKMKEERHSIDGLKPKRYVLATTVALTPANKDALAEIIGPSLLSTGDIFGADDLNALLRAHPEIERAHHKLWGQNTSVLEEVLSSVVRKAMASENIPTALSRLLPPATTGNSNVPEPVERDVVFIIKASPIDDEFTLWLAPKLEAEGYQIFADVLTLQPGDRWRREINAALRHRAVKVLLLCRDSTLADENVQDDLDIALELAKELGDQRFVIPLRMETFRKVKGLGDTVAVNFVKGWGDGLDKLLDTLQRQKVPRNSEQASINSNWEMFRRRGAIEIVNEPERLTSNWLRIAEAPDFIRYYESSGAIDKNRLQRALDSFGHPAALIGGNGFLAFADQPEIEMAFETAGRFKVKHEIPLDEFVVNGFNKLRVDRQTASNLVIAMMKRAWSNYCKRNGFIEYTYSNSVGFHASAEHAPTGKKIPWGNQADKKRSSMLRNSAKGHIWQFGVTAIPTFWPFWHFKLKSRVLFAEDDKTPTGVPINDVKKLHRLRRSVCKGWRNKQWYGRMLAFLELLSGESAFIRLPLSETKEIVIEATPMLFSSPVSTILPNLLDEDDEETDASTLGRPDNDEEAGE
ncbi:toll/interleukin-1 receptor domain-containing protein [Rhizobium sp. S153]|uniref:Toll/interleukin-1 receptor domain-containing protein n=1 Tax=Ciceribacter sichuanensis TaxID=2949647 RepID=A0ABT0VE74_9HYPH|nr:toll/interleukin-1 receptor domain-containing protein [Ciceribacter sp. S153]MCM2404210.1 toll/interleukin-1 receptor domain-containing protein [Ciceribacter sp. S153]